MTLEQNVIDTLRQVVVPDLHQDIVSLGMVKNLKAQSGIVAFSIEFSSPNAQLQAQLDPVIKQAIKKIPGVTDVAVHYMVNQSAGSHSATTSRKSGTDKKVNPQGIKHIVAIGSGKGGVGKSTVTANLAVSLAKSGLRVGVLDADIYGPSIPLLLGVSGQKPGVRNDKLLPIDAHGVSIMSMGLLLPSPDDPVVWRGPMLAGALRQFLHDVEWGELDLLLVDLPPGTGDIPLSLVQLIPLAGAAIVITPQPVAAAIGTKTLRMLQNAQVPIIGMIENMSYFDCPNCHAHTSIFDRGGGLAASKQEGVPFLGEIPLDPVLRRSGDQGIPVTIAEPDSPLASVFMQLGKKLWEAVNQPIAVT